MDTDEFIDRLLLMRWVTIWACLMILPMFMVETMVPAMVKV